MPIKITVEESEKTSLQTPKGKENPKEETSIQSSQGTEQEELPPAEPLAIPEDDELKPVDTIVIKDGENYKRVHVYEVRKQAKEQEGAKCQFCKGTGKVIVEKKGIKECPRCEGDGYTVKPQAELENHKDDQQIDDITQEEEIQGGIQPETEEQIEQDNSENEMEDFQEEQEPEDSDFGEPEEEKINTKAFESFVGKKIQVLKQKHPDKAVTLLMGTEVNGDYGSKKIKGTLAYAGVSLNDRIYLPEELAKGDGMTLPLLLNHSSTAGAEGELYRLQDDARQSLESGKDYKVGEVTLTWKPEALTLYYEGEVEHPFFQKEVDEADMAVSLGIYYDSDSPMLCNDQCYTVIKGAEFREVSLVYHAGFPVATIEAYEKLLKKKAVESMKGEPNINPEKANEYEKYTNNWWRNRKCQSCGKVLGDDWEKTPEVKTGDPLAGFRCEDCVDRLEDYRATYDPKFEGDDTGSQNPDLNDIWFGESKASEGYADRKSDLKKAWKTWKRGLKNHHEYTYNNWFEFAKDNGATDEEADDTWEWSNDEILRRDSLESKASEWTPSKAHDWQPPTQEDYKDLPKPTKNQKMAGSHDEPDFSNMKQDGRNRDTDGKFSKERKASEVFEFYEDESHGWLEVPKSLLKELGISDQISSYSYQKGDMAYLEEDADMSLFVNTYGSGGEIGYDSKDGSKIRQYSSYSA